VTEPVLALTLAGEILGHKMPVRQSLNLCVVFWATVRLKISWGIPVTELKNPKCGSSARGFPNLKTY